MLLTFNDDLKNRVRLIVKLANINTCMHFSSAVDNWSYLSKRIIPLSWNMIQDIILIDVTTGRCLRVWYSHESTSSVLSHPSSGSSRLPQRQLLSCFIAHPSLSLHFICAALISILTRNHHVFFGMLVNLRISHWNYGIQHRCFPLRHLAPTFGDKLAMRRPAANRAPFQLCLGGCRFLEQRASTTVMDSGHCWGRRCPRRDAERLVTGGEGVDYESNLHNQDGPEAESRSFITSDSKLRLL